jgi:sigma-B regulation protein RsbU (phosphoserine phosphatase)
MAQDELKILLVEHDEDFARYVAEMLGQARDVPGRILVKTSFSASLEALTHEPIELVIMDLALPDGAGLGNLAVLRAVAPHVPVVVMGASDEEAVSLAALNAGAKDYLIRNQLTPGWLERCIRYALERQQMESALLASAEQYHQLFDSLVEGIFQTTEEGRYILANAALARIYGYASSQELVTELTDISRSLYVQPGRREEFVRLMQEHDTISGFESQVHRKDGSVIWISENCRAVRDSAGGLLYYEGTVEEVTQRKLAEEKVRNSEALYHSLVETLPQNILRKDLQGKFTFVNQQFCRTLGCALDDVIGKTDFDFFPHALAEQYRRDDRRILESGQSYEAVEEHQPPGGETMYVQVVKTPLCDAEGRVIGIQGIFWDITQQRKAEQEIRRYNEELSRSRQELHAKNQQMEEDLRMAREIQLTMLPQQYPPFHQGGVDAESAIQFTHRYMPTGSVGGDFFSVSALSPTEAAVFICDVAGHGVRSALVTAMIRALVEELKHLATQPGQFLTQLNRDLFAILKHTGTPVLTTAFYLVADAEQKVMRYSNAGHPKPLQVQRTAGQVLPLANASGRSQPALGLFEDANYETTQTKVAPGDLVMLFTDGLYEVHDVRGELYSQKMLLEAVKRLSRRPATEIFDAVLEETSVFASGVGFTDDVCLVGMEIAPEKKHFTGSKT